MGAKMGRVVFYARVSTRDQKLDLHWTPPASSA
jgi:predicted site-specific integrase-resolvase